MSEAHKSTTVGVVFLRNPRVHRVLVAHIAAGRHQKAWDLSLCFAWKYTPTFQIRQVLAITAQCGLKFANLHRMPSFYLSNASMQVAPFIGNCLRPIAEKLFILGTDVDDIRLMGFAETIVHSGVDTDIRGADKIGNERRAAKRDSRISVVRNLIEIGATQEENKSTINERGKRNRSRAMGRR